VVLYDVNDSAYISTTTIGLGDFYLEPEVITGRDLLSFPLVILIGFVFFSAFLGKIGELFAKTDELPGQTLQDRLAATKIFRCCRRRNPPS
jgi:Ion channel